MAFPAHTENGTVKGGSPPTPIDRDNGIFSKKLLPNKSRAFGIGRYRAGCVEQRRQQIFLDVPDIGGVLVQTLKNVINVLAVQLQELFLDQRCGEIVA